MAGKKKSDSKKRKCLKCDKIFTSRGVHNRICLDCKEANTAENNHEERYKSKFIDVTAKRFDGVWRTDKC